MSTAMTTYVEYSNSVARAEVLVKAVENAADGLNASIEDACKILKFLSMIIILLKSWLKKLRR